MTDNVQNSYDYDLVVIGGGSGGMAAAKKVNVIYLPTWIIVENGPLLGLGSW